MPQQALSQLPQVKSHLRPCIIDLDSGDESSVAQQQPGCSTVHQATSSAVEPGQLKRSAPEDDDGNASSVPELSQSETEEAAVPRVRTRAFRRTGSVSTAGAPSAAAASGPGPLASVRVFSHTLPYRSLGSVVLFKAENLLGLIRDALPLAMSQSDASGGHKLSQHELRIQEEILKKEFISWNVLKTLLNDAIFDQALRDLLNSYASDEDGRVTKDAFFSGRLERDHVTLAGVDIAFVVSKGKVFFDILGSFTILGELKLAMRHRWDAVDQILERSGIKRKEAFRRCHKSASAATAAAASNNASSGRSFTSQRSHIAVRALKALVEGGLVPDKARRSRLMKIFKNLQTELDALTAKKDMVFKELKLTAEMIVRSSRFASRRSYSESSSCADEFEPKVSLLVGDFPTEDESNASTVNSGTELCGAACGRQYHFTIRCCKKGHGIVLGDKDVSYVVSRDDGQIFLDKCSAFTALGRMYVIRCSDYRKADRILVKAGLEPSKHYLFEKRNYGQDTPRNRRTHISFDAFAVLVHKGFSDSIKRDLLVKSVEDVGASIDALQKECPSYSGSNSKGDMDLACKEVLDTETLKSEPLEQMGQEPPAKAVNIKTEVVDSSSVNSEQRKKCCLLLGRAIPYRHEANGKIYLCLAAICDFLSDEDRLTPRLKRRARSLNVVDAFVPSYFKRGSDQFISAECMLKMIENDLVTPGQREALKLGLQNLLKKAREEQLQEEESKHGGQLPPPAAAELASLGDEDDDNGDSDHGEDVADFEETNFDLKAPLGPFTAPELNEKSLVMVLDSPVPYQIVNNTLYLEKKSMFQLFALSSGPFYRTYRAMDKVLESAKLCLDDAFLYEGRKRGYISSGALKVLAGHDFIADSDKKLALVARLSALESDIEALRTNYTLTLPSSQHVISYRCFGNTVYLHTLHVLRAVGFSPMYLENSPSKAYFALSKLLTQRGLNLSSCFLKQGKSKYVYMSMHALLVLFETEFGAFKDKQKMAVLKGEILALLRDQGLFGRGGEDGQKKVTGGAQSDLSSARAKYIVLGGGFSPLRYRIKDGVLFVHRKSCFETFGLEKVVMTCSRGYAPINEVLTRAGLALSDCYLPGKRERFAYISLRALLALLESQDPLLICLEKKGKFFESLLKAIQIGAAMAIVRQDSPSSSSTIESKEFIVKKLFLKGWSEKPLPFKLSGHRMYLMRHTAYTLAGLYEKADQAHGDYDIYDEPSAPLSDRGLNADDCFLSEGGDSFAYISVDALLILMNLDGDIARAGDYQKIIWKNLLSAIAMEAPKLKVHVKMSEFRSALVETLLEKFIAYLEHSRNLSKEHSDHEDFVEIVDLVTETETDGEHEEQQQPEAKRLRLSTCSATSSSSSGSRSNETSPAVQLHDAERPLSLSVDHAVQASRSRTPSTGSSIPVLYEAAFSSSSSSSDDEDVPPVTLEEFERMREEVLVNQTRGSIGDWQVQSCDAGLIRAIVAPGYGASKKMSFIHPDVSAVLSYTFVMQAGAAPQLFINDLSVPWKVVRGVYDRAKTKGLLNLLYNLLTLRPCFGSFNPELVETVERGLVTAYDLKVDHSFIGSSQNGRNYAGTVRAKDCKVLAASRVSDTCSHCEVLKSVVINRSVLSGGGGAGGKSGTLAAAATLPSSSAPNNNNHDGSRDASLHHKSVWQMAESSSSGCTFICPQLQSFNVSLPQQFRGHMQASSIMEHKVTISADLKPTIWLNGKKINRLFKEFQENKQVGPLLEWVSSLRLCIGYPDSELVAQARYLLEKKHVLQPEIRKFFDNVDVDETFKGRMSLNGSEFVGTLRTPTCRGVAGDHADICDQCRLLQEPIEFLGL